MNIEKLKSSKSFGGDVSFYSHESEVTQTQMRFSTFVPSEKVVDHAIIWLSGLTCTEENFITKSGVQSLLENTSTMVICPDTSPRGLNLENEHDAYDFGSGAGFYLNATTEGYKDHYNMYDYIKKEVVSILKSHFKIKSISIMGHSMGGHGALVLGLKEKSLFKSVSAFSPIVNPAKCAWGEKAFLGYLGSESAPEYDATELVKSGITRDDCIFIDQGLADEFLEEQLLTENFNQACLNQAQQVKICYREGYDHSYYYISTFLKEHITFHLEHLK